MLDTIAQVRAACDAAQDQEAKAKSLRIVMVRHGESAGNTLGSYFATPEEKEILKKLWPNEYDFPLTSVGVEQAKGLVTTLAPIFAASGGYIPDSVAVYSSNMVRANQTMMLACRGWAEACIRHDDNIAALIREKYSGPAIFIPRVELHKRYPNREAEWVKNPYTFEGLGESIQSCESRVLSTMDALLKKYAHEFSLVNTVVLFTHGGYMMAAECVATGMTIEQAKKLRAPHNCGVYEFEVSNEGLRLVNKHQTAKYPVK